LSNEVDIGLLKKWANKLNPEKLKEAAVSPPGAGAVGQDYVRIMLNVKEVAPTLQSMREAGCRYIGQTFKLNVGKEHTILYLTIEDAAKLHEYAQKKIREKQPQ